MKLLTTVCCCTLQRKTPEELEVIHFATQVASAAHVQVGTTFCDLRMVMIGFPVSLVNHSRGRPLANLRTQALQCKALQPHSCMMTFALQLAWGYASETDS